MTIRPAKPQDIDGIVALGIEALKNDPYEGLVISEERVREAARECISGANHFCWIAEDDGTVVAAVSAFALPMMFYERFQLTVVQFYSKAAGQGVKLLREMLRWADGRPAIKSIVFTLEHKADPRIGKLLRRLGFTAELPVYMKIRAPGRRLSARRG